MSSKGWIRFFVMFFTIIIAKFAMNLLYSSPFTQASKQRYSNSVYQSDQKEINLENDTNYNEVNTKDSARAKGLNMNIYVPSSWASFNAYNSENDLVGQFIRPLNDSFTVGLTVHIDKVDYIMTPEVISEFTKKDFLVKTGNLNGSLFSYNLITINKVKGVEVSFINATKNNCTYYRFYRLFKGHYAVTLTYAIVALTEQHATKMYNLYKPDFDKMAYKTELLN